MVKWGTLFLAVLIALFLFASYITFTFFFSDKSVEFIPKNYTENPSSQLSYYGDLQFYPNMRFNHNLISYKIDSSCSSEKGERMRDAMKRLENETGEINFIEKSGSGVDIGVSCDEMENTPVGETFIAGEGGPTSIINATQFYIIENGTVLLFYKQENKCLGYNVELHELLHVFGFKHSENENSIMYNTSSCEQVLTQDIVNELKRLHSIKPLSDLYFVNVSAAKHGIYLDFSVEVKNKGLVKADNVSLELYADNDKIDVFSLGDLDYGSGKIFSVTNVRIWAAENLKFTLADGEELDEGNNVMEFVAKA